MSGSTQPVTQSWRAAEPRYPPHAMSYPVQIARPHTVRPSLPSLPSPLQPGSHVGGCPQCWASASAAALTEKSDHFRACGTGFHCSSLMGSSFVSPYGAFSFSLPFQPFPSTCCGGAHGLWLIISEQPCPFVLLARAPLAGCSIQPGGKGEGLTIPVEQEHVPSSPLWHSLSLALNHRGRTIPF